MPKRLALFSLCAKRCRSKQTQTKTVSGPNWRTNRPIQFPYISPRNGRDREIFHSGSPYSVCVQKGTEIYRNKPMTVISMTGCTPGQVYLPTSTPSIERYNKDVTPRPLTQLRIKQDQTNHEYNQYITLLTYHTETLT